MVLQSVQKHIDGGEKEENEGQEDPRPKKSGSRLAVQKGKEQNPPARASVLEHADEGPPN